MGFVDVRWVDLDDLVENLDDEDLQPLEEYEKKLARRMSAQAPPAPARAGGREQGSRGSAQGSFGRSWRPVLVLSAE